MPISAVLDTNVWVNGLMSEEETPCQILDAWLERRYNLVISFYLAEELIHVLSCPGIAEHLPLDDAKLAVLAGLLSMAEVMPGQLRLPGTTPDPKDEAVMACAVEGGADYIVSDDEDLLALGEYEGIQIVASRQFVEILE